MRRLIKKNDYIPSIGDLVFLKNSPNDKFIYEIININEDQTLTLQNDTGTYVGIKPNTVKKIDYSAE